MKQQIKKWWTSHKEPQLSRDETEFLPAILEVTETPPSPVGRFVLWSIIALLMVAILWAFFGHVDEVAVATGKIVPIGQVKIVQAESKGVVKNILVKPGAVVKKGQILIELDQTFSAADLSRLKKQVAYANLEIERLTAEREKRPLVLTSDPNLDPKDLQFQMQLYSSRNLDYDGKLLKAQNAVQQQSSSLSSALINKRKYSDLLTIAKDKEKRLEDLVARDAVSLFQLLDARSRRIELLETLAAQDAEIERNQAALAEAQSILANIVAEHEKDIMTNMVEARKLLVQAAEELKKAEEKNRLAQLTAPVDGRVHQLAVHTIGGIVTEAQPLLMIVPEDVSMQVEAWAANKDIGFIQVGQQAEIKIETFNFQKYGILDAQVVEISPDATESNNDKEKDKKFRIVLNLNDQGVIVGNRQVPLTPGMAASAEIKIRKKRIVEFFLDPFRQYQSEALRER